MDRVALFIDAGYLFAQGSTLLAGSKLRREQIKLKTDAAISEFTAIARAKSGTDLLRIYWYDGAWGLPTAQHLELAHKDGVKLRLGFINTAGQQKGVDSLIVYDLIELARNRAISDAVLLSGDEDVRVGVQVAQTFGVRVHLVGIEPCRASQSKLLMQEADTTTELGNAAVSKILDILVTTTPQSTVASAVALRVPSPSVSSSGPSTTPVIAQQQVPGAIPVTPIMDRAGVDAALLQAVTAVLGEIDPGDLANIAAVLSATNVPGNLDRRLLGKSRTALARSLGPEERQRLRTIFVQQLKAAAGVP